jgi:hypothetical protein
MTDLARRGTPLVLAGWFAIASTALIVGRILLGGPFWFGSEAVLGTHAVRALLAGGNPWTTQFLGSTFTAPPPSLLPYLPFAILPDEIVAAMWVAIGVGSSIYAVRKLNLAAWWLAFPPLVAGVIAGSPAPLMVALLLRAGAADSLRGMAINAAAIVLHPFAALPTLALGRWRAALLAFDVTLVSVPFLAWGAFIGTAGGVAAAITLQTNGGLSAAVSPALFILAGAGLIALGPKRGAWLIVPALWPNAPFAYALLALPVLADMPLIAATLASPAAPGLIAYGIAAECGLEALRLRRPKPASRRWAPDELLAHHERRAKRAAPESPVSVERG